MANLMKINLPIPLSSSENLNMLMIISFFGEFMKTMREVV